MLPFEQLYTYDTAPPIKAVIDGMPVLCVSTHCSYSYQASTALITGLSVNLQEVTITGADLPLDLTSVRISNQECAVSSNTALEIICQIPNQWVAGQWLPEVRTAAGLVAIDASVLPYEVLLVVDAVTPDTYN